MSGPAKRDENRGPARKRADSGDDYGNSVVVTVTFRGPDRLTKAARLEVAAKRIGHSGIFTEQVEVEGV